MPQVDLETLVTACAGGGSDNKVACETLADSMTDRRQPDDDSSDDGDDVDEEVEVPPDFPPESFWLSKDAELDWFDRNAFYERKESTRGTNSTTNPNLNHPGTGSNSNSNSQRFSLNLKSKASIIGLPKTQKASYVDSKRRTCKPANIRLFPKRTESVGKSTVPVTEPSSPKVSCMGRVRSKRGRRRSTEHGRKREKQVERSRSGKEKRKTGLYSRVMGLFRSRKSRGNPVRGGNVEDVILEEEQTPRRSSVSGSVKRVREVGVGGEPAGEPPGLGGMKRFASGRRSESWNAEDADVVNSDSFTSRLGPIGLVRS